MANSRYSKGMPSRTNRMRNGIIKAPGMGRIRMSPFCLRDRHGQRLPQSFVRTTKYDTTVSPTRLQQRQDTEAHTVIPATWEAEIRRIKV
jgi:hypothetical protein